MDYRFCEASMRLAGTFPFRNSKNAAWVNVADRTGIFRAIFNLFPIRGKQALTKGWKHDKVMRR